MTIVNAREYRKGRLVGDLPIDGQRWFSEDSFAWIGLFEPDEAEMALIAGQFGLHPLAVEDAVAGKQLPKLDIYGDHLFVVARTAELHGGSLDYGETDIFVARHFIITIRHGSARSHSPLRTQMETAPALLAHGPDYVLHAILDFLVDGYGPIVDTLEDEVLAIEGMSPDGCLGHADLQRLFTVRRELVRFLRGMGLMEELVSRLVTVEVPYIDKETSPYFRDVLDHVRRVEFRITGLKDTLNSAVETSSLMEQQRQGVITRQLAAWAAILAVPTAIAGIYGMNFKYMPELETRYGYFVVVGVMATICVTLYVRFKRAGWL
jgi:magnesium transporter